VKPYSSHPFLSLSCFTVQLTSLASSPLLMCLHFPSRFVVCAASFLHRSVSSAIFFSLPPPSGPLVSGTYSLLPQSPPSRPHFPSRSVIGATSFLRRPISSTISFSLFPLDSSSVAHTLFSPFPMVSAIVSSFSLCSFFAVTSPLSLSHFFHPLYVFLLFYADPSPSSSSLVNNIKI
jgi:hypothetical protein